MRKIPTQGHSAELRVHQNRTVSVVPGQTQQARLARFAAFEPLRELGDSCSGAARDRIEDVACRGKPGLYTGVSRMYRTWNNAAHSRHQSALLADAHNA